MIKFVLMMWLASGSAGTTITAEFNSQANCEAAAAQMINAAVAKGAVGSRSFFVCVEK